MGANAIALPALRMPGMTRDRWTSVLRVWVLSQTGSGPDENPPLLGSYRVEGDVVRFEPRFPLEPGVRYRAEFDPVRFDALAETVLNQPGLTHRKPASTAKLTAEFSVPKKRVQSTTTVAQVYPSSTTLPENLLRLYIYFSAPMSRGEAYRRIKLIDPTGQPVDRPFLELDAELWSGDGRRFTLLFDPGRIKRGLKPREEFGPILEAGKSYSLVIDRDWPDATGSPLREEFRKTIRAGPADESSPDPKAWRVHAPRAERKIRWKCTFPNRSTGDSSIACWRFGARGSTRCRAGCRLPTSRRPGDSVLQAHGTRGTITW